MRHIFDHIDPEDPLLLQIPIKYVVAVFQLSAIVGIMWAILLQFVLIFYLLPVLLISVVFFAGYSFEKKSLMVIHFWINVVLTIFGAIFVCINGFNLVLGGSGEVAQFWWSVAYIALDIFYIWMCRKLINAVTLKTSTIPQTGPFYAKY